MQLSRRIDPLDEFRQPSGHLFNDRRQKLSRPLHGRIYLPIEDAGTRRFNANQRRELRDGHARRLQIAGMSAPVRAAVRLRKSVWTPTNPPMKVFTKVYASSFPIAITRLGITRLGVFLQDRADADIFALPFE